MAGQKNSEEARARARAATAAWRSKNREYHLASVKRWRLDNPEKYRAIYRRGLDRQKIARAEKAVVRRAEAAARRAANVDALREARRLQSRERLKREMAEQRTRRLENGRRWRLANPDRQKALIRAWKKAHPEKKRHKNAASRSRKVAWLMKAQRGKCAYCRTKIDPADCHVDHIEPLSRGGANRRTNMQLTCPPCNLSKSHHDPIVFAQSLGRLV